MIQDVQKRIVSLHNEIKAQKVYSGLTYSQLLLPERAPTQSYSDAVALAGSGPVAILRFRFIRSDGLIDPPIINFAFDASVSPTYKQFAQNAGFVFSANDLSYIDRSQIAGYIAEVGDGYVDFYIEYSSELRSMFFSLNSLTISATCQAISNVDGNLIVEKL